MCAIRDEISESLSAVRKAATVVRAYHQVSAAMNQQAFGWSWRAAQQLLAQREGREREAERHGGAASGGGGSGGGNGTESGSTSTTVEMHKR